MPTKHGEIQIVDGRRVASPEYRSWQMMKDRCYNPNSDNYEMYGARGIMIADDWWFFDLFLEDMGRRPTIKHTLDRVDFNGHYEKANCIWADPFGQNRNRCIVVLDEAKAAEIRTLYATKTYTQAMLALKFNTSQSNIGRVVRGEMWT